MTKFLSDDGKTTVELIAGEYNSLKGPAFTFSPVNLFNAKLSAGAKAEFSFSKKFNTGMLVIEGEIKINNSKSAPENNFIFFGHEGDDIIIEAVQNSTVLVLSGEPLGEPVASYGHL